jgi:hypothetical protein
LLLVVTPRSERGGRWFDSSPRNFGSSPHGSHPAGSGACLENRWRPESRLWVRVPRLPHADDRSRPRLGRQPEDHSRSDREMLRVRLPPEPSITPSWSSLECSPRCQRGGRGFKSRRGRWWEGWHGTQTGKATRLKPGDSVGSIPTRATRGWLSRVVLLTAACKTVAIEL